LLFFFFLRFHLHVTCFLSPLSLSLKQVYFETLLSFLILFTFLLQAALSFQSVFISFFPICPVLFIPYVFSHSYFHFTLPSSLLSFFITSDFGFKFFLLYYIIIIIIFYSFFITSYFGLYLFLPTPSTLFFPFPFCFNNLSSLPPTSSCFWDLCHCYTDILYTVGVQLMGWQTSACNFSNMPHCPSQPTSSTLSSALPPAARCRYCPSLFRTDYVPAYWPSFVRRRAQTLRQQKYFPTCHLLGHKDVTSDISQTSVALLASGPRRQFVS